MRAAQRIFGLVMVEMDRFPFGHLMTSLALRTIAIGMHVLQSVTGYA